MSAFGGKNSSIYINRGRGYSNFQPVRRDDLVTDAIYILRQRFKTKKYLRDVRVFTTTNPMRFQVFYFLDSPNPNNVSIEMNAIITHEEFNPFSPTNYCKIGKIQ